MPNRIGKPRRGSHTQVFYIGQLFRKRLYGLGTVLRFILRIALLSIQAVLTLLMLAIGFIGGLANIICWLLGAFL